MLLGDVRHQDFAHRLIQRAVGRESVPHAYLFHGPEGVGKERMARGLAQLLLCPRPVEHVLDATQRAALRLDHSRTGCGACEDCRAVLAQSHPDMHLIYRQLSREHPDADVRKRKALDLGVDVIRHFLIERVALTTIRGRAKVFIVQEADGMTRQAQNALLKTLEEPPGTTVIVLLATTMDRLLPTTISRCQIVRFEALPNHFIREKVDEILANMAPPQREWYTRCSQGSVGRALQSADDEIYGLNERLATGFAALTGPENGAGAHRTNGIRSDHMAAAWLEEAKTLANRYKKRDPDVTDTEAIRRAIKTALQLAARWFADVLHVGAHEKTAIVNTHLMPAIRRSAESLTAAQAMQAIQRIVQAERELDLNANTQLCVEVLLNDLARNAAIQTTA